MSYSKADYYAEGLDDSFAEHGVTATPEQIKAVSIDVAGYAEHEGQAFYTPPWSDRISDIERDWQTKYAALEKEFGKYRGDAELAVGKALKQYSDASLSIGPYGEVLRHDGINRYETQPTGGMTLRDYFAAHVLESDIETMLMRVKYIDKIVEIGTKKEVRKGLPDHVRQIARYMHADAMLKARSS